MQLCKGPETSKLWTKATDWLSDFAPGATQLTGYKWCRCKDCGVQILDAKLTDKRWTSPLIAGRSERSLWAPSDNRAWGRWWGWGLLGIHRAPGWLTPGIMAGVSPWQVKLTRVALGRGRDEGGGGYQLPVWCQLQPCPPCHNPCCNQLELSFSDTRRRTFPPGGGGGEGRLSGITCIHSNNEVYSGPAVTSAMDGWCRFYSESDKTSSFPQTDSWAEIKFWWFLALTCSYSCKVDIIHAQDNEICVAINHDAAVGVFRERLLEMSERNKCSLHWAGDQSAKRKLNMISVWSKSNCNKIWTRYDLYNLYKPVKGSFLTFVAKKVREMENLYFLLFFLLSTNPVKRLKPNNERVLIISIVCSSKPDIFSSSEPQSSSVVQKLLKNTSTVAPGDIFKSLKILMCIKLNLLKCFWKLWCCCTL